MISPSPLELPQPSCTPSSDTKPTTYRLSAWISKLLRAWAKLHVSYRGGRYSVERLLALDEYTRNASLLRVLLVCVATPLPMTMLVISQEAVPLQDPAAGWWANYGYWIRMGIVTLVVTHTLTVQAKFLVGGFAISWRQLLLLLVCSTTISYIADTILATYVGFPTPFSVLARALPFYTQLTVSFCAIVGRRVVREMLAHKDQMIRYAGFVSAQLSMVVCYPAYQVLFHATVDTHYRLLVILLLPFIKLIVKNVVLRCVTHMEDMMPEAVIFTVDFFNALYLATCMESAASGPIVLIIAATDLTQTATVLYGLYWRTATLLRRLRETTEIPNGDDNLLTRACSECHCSNKFEQQIRARVRIRSCLPHRLSSMYRDIVNSLEECPVDENAVPANYSLVQDGVSMKPAGAIKEQSWVRKKVSWICAERRSNAIQPTVARTITHIHVRGPTSGSQKRPSPRTTDALSHADRTDESRQPEKINSHHPSIVHSNAIEETLEALFTSECIVLTAYLETVIPVFYGLFMLVMVRLPSAKYHTELAGVTGENVGAAVRTVFIFATLQFLSFGVMSALIRRNLGMRSLYQLAFVLETQMELIQSKLMTWVLITIAFRVVHFGVDFTFKFNWVGSQGK